MRNEFDSDPERPGMVQGADGARHSTHSPFSLSDSALSESDEWDLSLIHDAVAFDDFEEDDDDV